MKTLLQLLLLGIVSMSCSKKQTPADAILIGKTWTGSTTQPWAEALAWRGDSIVFVGSEADAMAFEGMNTRVNRLSNGELIVPGFIDTHTHFVEGGFRLSSVQLRDAKTKEEFAQRSKVFLMGRNCSRQ